MFFQSLVLDRYILRHMLGTMFSVLAVVMSLMTLEHLPRLLGMTQLSGHRTYIVAYSVAGLLPEYGGIGLLVGLFLGIALTVRRLVLRAELDVIEACGIATSRWMRLPFVLAAMVSVLTMANQGWLMPAGEIGLANIYQRMVQGEFGHQLQADRFIDLGRGSVLHFDEVDAADGDIIGLFLRTDGDVYTARSGRFWKLPSGGMAMEMHDGQVVRERDGSVLRFDRLQHRMDPVASGLVKEPESDLLKRSDLELLWTEGTVSGRSAVYGRCLAAVLVLFVPTLALILGKPPRRQSGAAGILAGLIVLVMALKMITPLIDGHATKPEFLGGGILASWCAFVAGLVWAEKVLGQGFVDLWTSRALQSLRRPSAQRQA
ncbi:LptF/LptG family permease [Sphingomonas sp. 3-13AW]|uniref:LptF/LptG family permease n=1 Tax=Sphingomonas sp. 3-13AW TaxID=3050450 RepID=UPI003BB7C8E8